MTSTLRRENIRYPKSTPTHLVPRIAFAHDVLAILRYDVFGNVLRANHVPAEHPLVGIRVVLHPCGTEVVLTVHSRREDEEAQAADLGVSRVTPLASSGARLWSRSLNP